MALDWDRIGTGDSEALLRPRDIYAGLANRPWPYLRHEQGEVLDQWFDHRRHDRDVVIKQNTGGQDGRRPADRAEHLERGHRQGRVPDAGQLSGQTGP